MYRQSGISLVVEILLRCARDSDIIVRNHGDICANYMLSAALRTAVGHTYGRRSVCDSSSTDSTLVVRFPQHHGG